MTGKLRAAYAEVGRDAPPYSYRTDARVEDDVVRRLRLRLHRPEPNPQAGVREVVRVRHGAELPERSPRRRCDVRTTSRPQNQIVQNLRESYGTGFVLFNLNGASTENKGTRDHGARHAGGAAQLLVGRAGQLRAARAARRSRCRTRCRSRTSPTRGCTATCATARSRACRRCR